MHSNFKYLEFYLICKSKNYYEKFIFRYFKFCGINLKLFEIPDT